MSQFSRFAERLHELRETMQRQEEAALSRLAEERRAIAAHVAAIRWDKQAAAQSRDEQSSVNDVVGWHQYVMALEQREQQQQARLTEAEQRVDHQRGKVMTAYQDTRRWEMLVVRLRERETQDENRQAQKEADELALQRMNREDF